MFDIYEMTFNMPLYAETRLANARRGKGEDAIDDDTPSTSGRQYTDATDVSKVMLLQSWFY